MTNKLVADGQVDEERKLEKDNSEVVVENSQNEE